MAYDGERVVVFQVASLGAFVETIGGVDYYRVDPTVFLPWADNFRWTEIKWHPLITHMAVTGAPPVQAATVGAAVDGLAPARCAIWPVPAGSTTLTTANLAAASSTPIVLLPGESVDLGGHDGDLLLSEGPQGGVGFEAWSWQNAVHVANLADALGVRVAAQPVRYSGEADFDADTLAAAAASAAAAAGATAPSPLLTALLTRALF